jgi:hypothetical protein
VKGNKGLLNKGSRATYFGTLELKTEIIRIGIGSLPYTLLSEEIELHLKAVPEKNWIYCLLPQIF